MLEIATSLAAAALALCWRCSDVCLPRRKRAAALLTPRLLTEVFRRRYGLKGLSPDEIVVSSAEVLSVSSGGDGKSAITDRIRLKVKWSSERARKAAGVPDGGILCKFCLLHWIFRMGASPRVIRVVGNVARLSSKHLPIIGPQVEKLIFWGLNVYCHFLPHAPDAMYINETRVFREVLPILEDQNVELARRFPDLAAEDPAALRFEAPACYGTVFEPSSSAYAIFMEDLCGRTGTRFPDAHKDELSLGEMKSVLCNLAVLHGRFWESERLMPGGDLSWLPDPNSDAGIESVFKSIGFGLVRDHVLGNAFAVEALRPLNRSVEQLWRGLEVCNKRVLSPDLEAHRRDPKKGFEEVTLCHGDSHIQNIFVMPDGRCGHFDFQLTLRCCWARDVAYILATGISIETRQKHQRELLSFYLDQLTRQIQLSRSEGPDPSRDIRAPDLDRAMQSISQAMAWCLVIGWLICPPKNYGVEIWLANVDRLVGACRDMNTFGLLEEMS